MKRNNKSKILAGMLAVIFTVSFSSCNNNKSEKSKTSEKSSSSSSSQTDSSSKTENSSADSVNSENNDSDNSSEKNTDSSQAEFSQGEKIKKAYDYFNGKEYYFKERITDNNGKSVIITETRKGDDFYRLQETPLGKSGKIKVGKESFDFDLECGIFKKGNDEFPENMVKSVVEQKLPQTKTHIKEEDTKKYDVEEYTYTGSTYITVMDFCFNKKSGNLEKYTVTYQVEGKDDEVTTRDFVSMKDKADEKLLNTSFVHTLTDFENLDSEKRAEFCRMIIDKKHISSDAMVMKSMTTDKLKTISYEDFTDFVYSSINNDSSY